MNNEPRPLNRSTHHAIQLVLIGIATAAYLRHRHVIDLVARSEIDNNNYTIGDVFLVTSGYLLASLGCLIAAIVCLKRKRKHTITAGWAIASLPIGVMGLLIFEDLLGYLAAA